MSTKTRRLDELTYFNAIACLIVIFIHVVSYGIVTARPDSWQAATIYFPWLLSACVVPSFIFSSAVKTGLQYEEQYTVRKYVGFMAGRFKNIYLPYFLWSIVYYATYIHLRYLYGSLPDFLTRLFLGTMSSPFYYIVIAMQFYLLKPVWLWIMKHIQWYIAIPCSVLISFASLKLNSILGPWGLSFRYTDRIFTTYLIFWMIGLYAGRNWEKLTESLARSGKSVCMAIVTILAAAIPPYLQYSKGIYMYETSYFKVFTDCLSIFVLLWVCLKLRDAAVPVKKTLAWISAASFSVYLSHCLFLTLAEHYIPRMGITKISVVLLIRFVVCYSIPFLLYALFRCLRARFRRRTATTALQ